MVSKLEEAPVIDQIVDESPASRRRLPPYESLTEAEDATSNRQYMYAAAWAARVLASSKPTRHIDISASPFFAAIASAFVPIDFYQYGTRPTHSVGLRTGTIDFDRLPFRTGSVPSLSCIDLVQRVGSGLMGDQPEPEGDQQAMAELKRVLAPDGSLLLVCPVGKPRADSVERVYSFGQILDRFEGLDLEEFSLVPDAPADRPLLVNPDEHLAAQQSYGYGCFWFRRPAR